MFIWCAEMWLSVSIKIQPRSSMIKRYCMTMLIRGLTFLFANSLPPKSTLYICSICGNMSEYKLPIIYHKQNLAKTTRHSKIGVGEKLNRQKYFTENCFWMRRFVLKFNNTNKKCLRQRSFRDHFWSITQ